MAANVLSITPTYADGTILTNAQLTAVNTTIVNWAQDAVDNLNQIVLDAFGSSYTLDNDAIANRTNTLYQKQNSTDSDVGDTSLTVATTWTDVDAADSSIAITPEAIGDFLFLCSFSVEIIASAASANSEVYFRLTDGTTHSVPVQVQMITGANGNASDTMTVPVTLFHRLSNLAVSAQTLKLQYFRNVHTNITTVSVIANGATTYGTSLYVEKV